MQRLLLSYAYKAPYGTVVYVSGGTYLSRRLLLASATDDSCRPRHTHEDVFMARDGKEAVFGAGVSDIPRQQINTVFVACMSN